MAHASREKHSAASGQLGNRKQAHQISGPRGSAALRPQRAADPVRASGDCSGSASCVLLRIANHFHLMPGRNIAGRRMAAGGLRGSRLVRAASPMKAAGLSRSVRTPPTAAPPCPASWSGADRGQCAHLLRRALGECRAQRPQLTPPGGKLRAGMDRLGGRDIRTALNDPRRPAVMGSVQGGRANEYALSGSGILSLAAGRPQAQWSGRPVVGPRVFCWRRDRRQSAAASEQAAVRADTWITSQAGGRRSRRVCGPAAQRSGGPAGRCGPVDALTNASGRLVVSTVLASRPPVELALLFVVVSLPSLSGLLAAGRPADRNRPVRPTR